MEVEKRSLKGGFFQLFDWNTKSKKKLFPSKSDLPECSTQGKENPCNVALLQNQQIKLLENEPNLSFRGSDHYCVSSVSSDDGSGTKAPGVVARLMGLDSLPTSDATDPYSTPSFNTHSFRDSDIPRTSSGFQNEHQFVDYGNTRNKLDGVSSNTVELRLQKVQNRPIDRFQSEVLPPKSARSISITHHRLLSPIKSPGFILTKNAASVMEEAAKIIEQSPRSTTMGKLSPFVSASVPLKIRNLKEKLEASQRIPRNPSPSQRLKDNHSTKYMKGKPSERGLRGADDSQHWKSSAAPKQDGSRSLKDKGKSPSKAIQATTNILRREGLVSNGSRSSKIPKRDTAAKSNNFDMKQPNMKKNVQKRTSANGSSDVLKLNNLKQNCASSIERVGENSQSAPNQQERKGISSNSSLRVNKTVKKIVESSLPVNNEANRVVVDIRKELLLSNSKSALGKKRSGNGNMNWNRNSHDNALISKNERSVKCNVSVDEFTNWGTVDGKTGTDVISFTFTSPIKKSLPGVQTSGELVEKKMSVLCNADDDQSNSKISYLSSLGLNVVGSDALSVLLEQKLKELACRAESSDYNLFKQEQSPSSSGSPLQDSVPNLCAPNSTAFTEHEKALQLGLHNKNSGNRHDPVHSPLDELLVGAKQKWQESKELERSINNHGFGKELECHYPIPIKSQPSFSGGSCKTSDSKISFSSKDNLQCLSAETCETISCISSTRPQYVEDETELSDSASSVSVWSSEKNSTATKFGYRKFERSSNWELEYVKGVLINTDLMLEDFVLGNTREVINCELFDHLENHIENQKTGPEETTDEDFKLERTHLFDCLNECLEFRCERVSGGSYKAWMKLTTLFQRKDLLAEELYKEMRGWTSMTELMVDELVEKEMSTHFGKWLDFETEEFEEGLDLENGILSSLVDDLVIDLLSS